MLVLLRSFKNSWCVSHSTIFSDFYLLLTLFVKNGGILAISKMYSSGYPPPGGEGMQQGTPGNGAPPGYNTPVSQPPPG